MKICVYGEELHTMPRLTVTINEDQAELLEELSGEGGVYDSKSAVVRDFIQSGEEKQKLEQEIVDLKDRLESREQRIEDLEEQLARRSEIEDRVDELALELRENREKPDPPWPVRWLRWFRSD